jgi:hypothetical protein
MATKDKEAKSESPLKTKLDKIILAINNMKTALRTTKNELEQLSETSVKNEKQFKAKVDAFNKSLSTYSELITEAMNLIGQIQPTVPSPTAKAHVGQKRK